MIDYRDYFVDFIPEEEIDEFMEWAFGEDWEELDSCAKLIQCWNNEHFRDYRLSIHGDINRDIPILVDLWNVHKKEE